MIHCSTERRPHSHDSGRWRRQLGFGIDRVSDSERIVRIDMKGHVERQQTMINRGCRAGLTRWPGAAARKPSRSVDFAFGDSCEVALLGLQPCRREWLDSTCCENSFSAPVSDGAPQSERARSQGQELPFRGNAKEFCAAPQAGGGVGTAWATQSKQKDAASGGLAQDGLAVKRKRCPVEAGLE